MSKKAVVAVSLVKKQECIIPPLNLQRVEFTVEGTAIYVQHRFSQEAMDQIRGKQEAGGQAKKMNKREAKDFHKRFIQAQHVTTAGRNGIPAMAFLKSMVSACGIVDFKMTVAKKSLAVEAHEVSGDGTNLVLFAKGQPRMAIHHVRLPSGGTDLSCRAVWDAGWRAKVIVRFDATRFTATDVANLLVRAGAQVGIGCGRPDSPNSCGCGWGTFTIVN